MSMGPRLLHEYASKAVVKIIYIHVPTPILIRQVALTFCTLGRAHYFSELFLTLCHPDSDLVIHDWPTNYVCMREAFPMQNTLLLFLVP